MAKLMRAGVEADILPESVEPANGRDFQLDELYKMLDCQMIEIVHPKAHPRLKGKILVIDEEGKLKNKQVNFVATLIFGYWPGDLIVGDALLCDEGEIL